MQRSCERLWDKRRYKVQLHIERGMTARALAVADGAAASVVLLFCPVLSCIRLSGSEQMASWLLRTILSGHTTLHMSAASS